MTVIMTFPLPMTMLLICVINFSCMAYQHSSNDDVNNGGRGRGRLSCISFPCPEWSRYTFDASTGSFRCESETVHKKNDFYEKIYLKKWRAKFRFTGTKAQFMNRTGSCKLTKFTSHLHRLCYLLPLAMGLIYLRILLEHLPTVLPHTMASYSRYNAQVFYQRLNGSGQEPSTKQRFLREFASLMDMVNQDPTFYERGPGILEIVEILQEAFERFPDASEELGAVVVELTETALGYYIDEGIQVSHLRMQWFSSSFFIVRCQRPQNPPVLFRCRLATLTRTQSLHFMAHEREN